MSTTTSNTNPYTGNRAKGKDQGFSFRSVFPSKEVNKRSKSQAGTTIGDNTSSTTSAPPTPPEPIVTLKDIASTRKYLTNLRQPRGRFPKKHINIALVPTMGALHAGHMRLIKLAAQYNPHVVVSIFVNPTQFGVHEDLDAYPRTFEQDMEKLKQLNEELAADPAIPGRVSAVFAPTTAEMYPSGPPSSALDAYGSFVTITPMGSLLEGKSRPVFFRGVATVVLKLLNVVTPTSVYFGQKDAQQCALIQRLVEDFHVDTKVFTVSTAREEDGLAISSRNVFLGARRRNVAKSFAEALQSTIKPFQAGILARDEILAPALEILNRTRAEQEALEPSKRVLIELEYLSLTDQYTMEEIDIIDRNRGAVVSAALRLLPVEDPAEGEDLGEGDGATRVLRLIDNVLFRPGLDEDVTLKSDAFDTTK